MHVLTVVPWAESWPSISRSQMGAAFFTGRPGCAGRQTRTWV